MTIPWTASIMRISEVHSKLVLRTIRKPAGMVGAKCPADAHRLNTTVDAMLPRHWDIRLVNRNTEPLTGSETSKGDLVMTAVCLQPAA